MQGGDRAVRSARHPADGATVGCATRSRRPARAGRDRHRRARRLRKRPCRERLALRSVADPDLQRRRRAPAAVDRHERLGGRVAAPGAIAVRRTAGAGGSRQLLDLRQGRRPAARRSARSTAQCSASPLDRRCNAATASDPDERHPGAAEQLVIRGAARICPQARRAARVASRPAPRRAAGGV